VSENEEANLMYKVARPLAAADTERWAVHKSFLFDETDSIPQRRDGAAVRHVRWWRVIGQGLREDVTAVRGAVKACRPAGEGPALKTASLSSTPSDLTILDPLHVSI